MAADILNPNTRLASIQTQNRLDSECKNLDFLILSFRRVLYVICFLLGNSPASHETSAISIVTPGNYP